MLTHEGMTRKLGEEVLRMAVGGKSRDYIDGFASGVSFICKMVSDEMEEEAKRRSAIYRERFEKLNLREIFGEEKE